MNVKAVGPAGGPPAFIGVRVSGGKADEDADEALRTGGLVLPSHGISLELAPRTATASRLMTKVAPKYRSVSGRGQRLTKSSDADR